MLDFCGQVGSNAIAALLGGLVAGGFALFAAHKTHRNDLEFAARESKERLTGLLQAIHDELETVQERYQETMGAQIEALPPGNALEYYYPVANDYFPIYNSNTALLGNIKDHDLRRQIVRTYTLAKGLVDSLRMNNDLLQKQEYWNALGEETGLEVHKQRATQYAINLVAYAEQLKNLHKLAKDSCNELLRSLRKAGVLAPNGA